MFCTHCGAENVEGARFCASCGRDVQPAVTGRRPQPEETPNGTELGLIPGQVLAGRFAVKTVLGAGGMGRVYLAQDNTLERPVAIKVLRELLSRDTGSVRRLIEEAKASIRLAHPNIVRVDDYHDVGTTKFLAMEYVEGETLSDRIAREPKLTEAEVRQIAIQICHGLEHAHAQKVIHRDLKPGNILLAKSGAIKIADFGIARVARDSVSRLTAQADSGTLLYMSPEQMLGKSNERSDIYSLGVVLYEMVAGDPPFQSGDISYQIREVAPEPLHGISTTLAAAIMKCLQKDPGARFESVKGLRDELERKAAGAVPLVARQANAAGPALQAGHAPEPPGAAVKPANQASLPLSGTRIGRIMMCTLLGALGFGGIALACGYFIYDADPLLTRWLFFVCLAVSGLLGPALLRLSRKTRIWFAAISLATGTALLLLFNGTSGDVEDAVPFLIGLFLVGGAAFGAYSGFRDRQRI